MSAAAVATRRSFSISLDRYLSDPWTQPTVALLDFGPFPVCVGGDLRTAAAR